MTAGREHARDADRNDVAIPRDVDPNSKAFFLSSLLHLQHLLFKQGGAITSDVALSNCYVRCNAPNFATILETKQPLDR